MSDLSYSLVAVMHGVREHAENFPVELYARTEGGEARLVISGLNQGGHDGTSVDLLDLLDWLSKNKPEILAKYARPAVSHNIVEWLASGERGASSEAMLQAITGIPCAYDPHAYPLDSDDFRRCLVLLEKCPELKDGMDKVAAISPMWKLFVIHWQSLADAMETSHPTWREVYRGSPQVTFMIRELRKVAGACY